MLRIPRKKSLNDGIRETNIASNSIHFPTSARDIFLQNLSPRSSQCTILVCLQELPFYTRTKMIIIILILILIKIEIYIVKYFLSEIGVTSKRNDFDNQIFNPTTYKEIAIDGAIFCKMCSYWHWMQLTISVKKLSFK